MIEKVPSGLAALGQVKLLHGGTAAQAPGKLLVQKAKGGGRAATNKKISLVAREIIKHSQTPKPSLPATSKQRTAPGRRVGP